MSAAMPAIGGPDDHQCDDEPHRDTPGCREPGVSSRTRAM